MRINACKVKGGSLNIPVAGAHVLLIGLERHVRPEDHRGARTRTYRSIAATLQKRSEKRVPAAIVEYLLRAAYA